MSHTRTIRDLDYGNHPCLVIICRLTWRILLRTAWHTGHWVFPLWTFLCSQRELRFWNTLPQTLHCRRSLTWGPLWGPPTHCCWGSTNRQRGAELDTTKQTVHISFEIKLDTDTGLYVHHNTSALCCTHLWLCLQIKFKLTASDKEAHNTLNYSFIKKCNTPLHENRTHNKSWIFRSISPYIPNSHLFHSNSLHCLC